MLLFNHWQQKNCCVPSSAPPKIVVSPVPNFLAFHGSSPSLLCVAEGSPTPTVTWIRNLMPLNVDPRYLVVSEGGRGVLSIRNATVFDQGQYSCVASNPLQAIRADVGTNLDVSNG